MGFPAHKVDLLIALSRSQESAVRIACGTSKWFGIGRGVRQDSILSPQLCSA